MKKILFEIIAHEQFQKWEVHNKKVFKRITELLDDIRQNPFKGIGKPEPLKHQFKGYWSRRIDKEHRLVYKVNSDSIIVISCMYHY